MPIAKLQRQSSVPQEYRNRVNNPQPYITRAGGLRPDVAKYPYSAFANKGQGGALAPATLKLYTNIIQNLLANYDGTRGRTLIEEDFRSPRKVLKVLDEAAKDPASNKVLSTSTQKTRINAILWNISEYDPTGDRKPGINTEVGKIYFEARDKQFKDIDRKATYKQTEKTIPWNKLKDLWEQYPEGSIDRAILAVYSLFPPRRLKDYSEMKVINTNKKTPGTNNYLLLQPQTPETPGAYTSAKFIFGDYKTAKSYGIQRFDVPQKLFEQLLPIAKDRIGASLFYNNRTKEKLAQSTFSERMSEAVKAKVDPNFKKNAGPTIFRHSYITHFLESNPDTKKRKEIAMKMAHTIGMQLLYDEREKKGEAYCPCNFGDEDEEDEDKNS
jgi:hypothetical protein